MKKIFGTLLLAWIVVGATSCQDDKEASGFNWGTTEYYEGFLWKDYEPVEMKGTLSFELNPDAQQYLANEDSEIIFKVITADGKRPEHVDVTFNGEKCEDYEFAVKPNGGNVEGVLGIIFHNTAPEGAYELNLKYIGCNNVATEVMLDGKITRLDGRSELKSANVTGVGIDAGCIHVEKIDITNPLQVSLTWIAIIFVVLVVLWLLILRRLLFQPIAMKTISFTGPGNFGGNVKIKGCYRVVFTDRNQKQGFFHKFFHGKILYVVNPVWDSEVTLEHRNSKSVRMRTTGEWTCSGLYLTRGEDYVISNSATKDKGEIRVS